MTSTISEPRRRVSALDGLRGIAALVVVLNHLLRVLAPVEASYVHPRDIPPITSGVFWIQFTPLRLVSAGDEAVLVFFVLSGFVLALAPLERERFDWVAYIPRRIVRLYLPTIGALVLACAIILGVPRNATSPDNPWLGTLFTVPVTPAQILGNATIIFGPEQLIDPVLWSLVWEVWFSLLLSLFVAIVLLCRRFWWISFVIAFAACWAGVAMQLFWLSYLPIFLFGVGLARGARDLRRLAARIDSVRFGTFVWIGLVVIALLGLIWRWLFVDRLPYDGVLDNLTLPVTAVAAALLTACCAFWVGSARFLTWRPVAWLGRVSFSLYLVHFPIVLAVTFTLGDNQWPLIVAIALPASLVVAWVFYRVVEAPSHRLSLRVGKLIESKESVHAGEV